uniref:WYL domain-containing protein n=1 Tax=Fusobacterium nucleatum subsp. polymorphum TaxID=76857 RepID=UPI003007FC32
KPCDNLVKLLNLLRRDNAQSWEVQYFETSEEQAKMYFRGFSKEAEILEPLSLREEIIKEYQEALNIYK